MYALQNSATFHFPPQSRSAADGGSSSETYVLDIERLAGDALVTIASDQSLSCFAAANIVKGPVTSLATRHGVVTGLEVFDWQNGVVCTTGEDGGVAVWDLRAGREVVRFQASETPILSMACNAATQTIAVGTELQNHAASIHLWDIRSSPTQKASYTDLHSDDITTLSFHPTKPTLLLSGSTDGLVSVHDTTITDEDELTVQTFNHNASIHHAGFLSATEVVALSHDERFALYDAAEEVTKGDAKQDFGDMREVLGCQYVADVTPKSDASGAVVGAGAQDRQSFELTFLAKTASDGWVLDRENSVALPGAHGEEIVRGFCFFDQDMAVFTAGEDGCVKAWRPGS